MSLISIKVPTFFFFCFLSPSSKYPYTSFRILGYATSSEKKKKQAKSRHIKINYKSVSWSCKQSTWFKVMSSLDKYTVNMHLQLHEQVLRVVFLTLIIYNECTWNLPWAVIFTSTLSCGRKKKSWRIIYEPAYFCVLSWEDFFCFSTSFCYSVC